MAQPNPQESLGYDEADSWSELHNPTHEPSSPWLDASEAEQLRYSYAYGMGRWLGYTLVVFSQKQAELDSQQADLQLITERVKRDDMTGLFTREYLIDDYYKLQAGAPHRRQSEVDTPHALMVLDADHFKRINDTYGHDVGDQTLMRLAAIFQDNVKRDQDVVARIGGEEFGVLLPNTPIEHATDIADRLRFAVVEDELLQEILATAAIKLENGDAPVLTVSIGLTELRLQESFRENYRRADKAMYEAKHKGRNLVVIR